MNGDGNWGSRNRRNVSCAIVLSFWHSKCHSPSLSLSIRIYHSLPKMQCLTYHYIIYNQYITETKRLSRIPSSVVHVILHVYVFVSQFLPLFTKFSYIMSMQTNAQKYYQLRKLIKFNWIRLLPQQSLSLQCPPKSCILLVVLLLFCVQLTANASTGIYIYSILPMDSFICKVHTTLEVQSIDWYEEKKL